MSQPPYQPPYQRYETRRDIDAAIAARRELGPEYEEHVAAGLAERVEQLAAMRTAELRVAAEGPKEPDAERSARSQSFVLGIISLGAGIPITAIAADSAHLPGIAVAWLGIIGVNVANSLSRRPRRRS